MGARWSSLPPLLLWPRLTSRLRMRGLTRAARRAQRRAGHVFVCSPVDGRGFVWGGYKESSGHYEANESKYRDPCEILVFESTTQRWTSRTTSGQVPPPMSGAAGVIDECNQLFIIGGFTQCGLASAEVFVLDLCSMIWRHVDVSGPKPLASDKLSAFVYNQKIFVLGGYGPGPSLDTGSQSAKIIDHYVYRNSEDEEDFCEEVTDRLVLPPWCRHEVDDGQEVRLHHGWNNQLAVLDPITSTWSWPRTSGRVPSPRAAHDVALVGRNLFVFGGRLHDKRLNDLFVLDLGLMHWRRLAKNEEADSHYTDDKSYNVRPRGRSWHSLTPLSDTFAKKTVGEEVKLLVYGGYDTLCRPCGDCWMVVINLNDRHNSVEWIRCRHLEQGARLWHKACVSKDRPGTIFVVGGVVNDLLGTTWWPEHPETMLTLCASPESLLELSLRCILDAKSNAWLHSRTLQQFLPRTLSKIVVERKRSDSIA